MVEIISLKKCKPRFNFLLVSHRKVVRCENLKLLDDAKVAAASSDYTGVNISWQEQIWSMYLVRVLHNRS